MLELENFNQRVIASHNQDGLVDKTASPNENMVYHFYSNGEISYQKGGTVYLQRSEFTKEGSIYGARRLPFAFVKEAADGTTYAVLTEEQCYQFRDEMLTIVKKYNNMH